MTDRPGLHDLIKELRLELEKAELHDSDRSAKLRDLSAQIEARLDTHIEEDHQREIAEELNEEIVEFAAEHPELAASIRSIVNMLSSIGI